ncbi:unnamed protein product [Sphagnum balticum]
MEGETKKEPVEWLNTELLQGQMRLRTKVVAVMRQRLVTAWASASRAGVRFSVVLFKFTTSKDCQAALRRRKGLVGTNLGLEEDVTPT